jgi:hypothetical protein
MRFPLANELPIGTKFVGAALFLGKRYLATLQLQSDWRHRLWSETWVTEKTDSLISVPFITFDFSMVKIATVASACWYVGAGSSEPQLIQGKGDDLELLRDVSRRCYGESAES